MPWCLALIFLLTIGWTAFVAWTLANHGNYASNSLLAIDTAGKSGPVAPLILLLAVCVVSLADSLEGMVVVTKRYLDSKLVEPIRRKLRAEGAMKTDSKWRNWYERQREAVDRGEQPFNEPPPDPPQPDGEE